WDTANRTGWSILPAARLHAMHCARWAMKSSGTTTRWRTRCAWKKSRISAAGWSRCWQSRERPLPRSGFAAEPLDQVGDVLVHQLFEFAFDHRRDDHLHQAGQGQRDLAVDLELDAGRLLVVLDLPAAADQRVADALHRCPHHRALGFVADVLAGVDGLDVHLRGAHLFHLPLEDTVAHVRELVDFGEVRHRG